MQGAVYELFSAEPGFPGGVGSHRLYVHTCLSLYVHGYVFVHLYIGTSAKT